MSKEKRHRTTVTVRLTDEEYDVLTRLCDLQQTTRTAYLARVATRHAKQALLSYAVDEYRAGRASLSELATRTGLDVPTIMDAVARITGESTEAVDGFCPRLRRCRSCTTILNSTRWPVKPSGVVYLAAADHWGDVITWGRPDS